MASGAPSAPMSSDRARSNQTCACAEPFSSDGARGFKNSAALAGQLSAATAIAAAQTLVAIFIASSPPGDLDPPVLSLSDAGIGGDRQLRFTLGQHLEPVGRNAPSDETFQHRRRAELGDFKIDGRIAGAVRGASQDHDDGFAFVEGPRRVVEDRLVVVSDRCAAHVEIDDKRRGRGRRCRVPPPEPQAKRRGRRLSRRPVRYAYSWLLSLVEVVLITAKWLSPDRLSSTVPGRTMRPSLGWRRRTGPTPTTRPICRAIVSSGA